MPVWQGNRADYVPWLQRALFPDDWEGQALVSVVIYSDCLPLTYQPEADIANIRASLRCHKRSELQGKL